MLSDETAQKPATNCVIIAANEVLFSSLFVCLSVCLLATLRKNFRTNLHEIFTKGWPVNKRLNFGSDPDPYRDTGKMSIGGGTHYPSV